MLFQAVVIFLPISIFFKILSNGGKVHCTRTPRKRDYNEIAEDATRSTSCIENNHPTMLDQQFWAMVLPFKQAFKTKLHGVM